MYAASTWRRNRRSKIGQDFHLDDEEPIALQVFRGDMKWKSGQEQKSQSLN